MRSIASRLRAGSRAASAIAALIFCSASPAYASVRPKYGGTLRVELAARVATLDPRMPSEESASALAQERLDALLFDRLVRFNDRGTLEGVLAASWTSDDQMKRWIFELRPNVKFADGMSLTADVAAQALGATLGANFQVSGNALEVTIESSQPAPDLPERLATGRNFIFRVASDGSLAGTGPFKLDEWAPDGIPGRAVFLANENCWFGRPFVDRVEVSLGVEPQRIEADLEFGLADLADLSPAELRRATQRGVRVWSSKPSELLALVFDPQRPAVQDSRLRQAISLAVDRNAIATVILQREAVPAGGLLPDWVSGYSFLFPTTLDVTHARALMQSAGSAATVPLVLVYDASDAETKAVAERVAVNLRDAGIAMQTVASMNNGPQADARLVRLRIASPEPRAALLEIFAALGITSVPPPADVGPEALYAAERTALADNRVVPLVHETQGSGLGANVRDWMALDSGEWRLDDVWLERPAAGAPANQPAASGQR